MWELTLPYIMWVPGTKFRSSGPVANRIISLVLEPHFVYLYWGGGVVWEKMQEPVMGTLGTWGQGVGGGDKKGQVDILFPIPPALLF